MSLKNNEKIITFSAAGSLFHELSIPKVTDFSL